MPGVPRWCRRTSPPSRRALRRRTPPRIATAHEVPAIEVVVGVHGRSGLVGWREQRVEVPVAGAGKILQRAPSMFTPVTAASRLWCRASPRTVDTKGRRGPDRRRRRHPDEHAEESVLVPRAFCRGDHRPIIACGCAWPAPHRRRCRARSRRRSRPARRRPCSRAGSTRPRRRRTPDRPPADGSRGDRGEVSRCGHAGCPAVRFTASRANGMNRAVNTIAAVLRLSRVRAHPNIACTRGCRIHAHRSSPSDRPMR